MEARVLDAMRTRKQAIEHKAQKDRCISRVMRMGTIVEGHMRTHHPYDFHLLLEDVCRLPDIRRVIIDGTDEEFDTRAEEVTSRLPELTVQCLEERTAKVSALLPFEGQSGNAISLATAWVRCGSCGMRPMHATHALNHNCSIPCSDSSSEKPIAEATFDIHVPRRAWCGGATKLEFAADLFKTARELALNCGEDPGSITWAEINTMLHRLVRHNGSYPIVYAWSEMVCPTGFIGVRCCGLTARSV